MSDSADLVITGGTLVSAEAVLPASLAIKDGRIMAIGDAAAMPAAREVLDATGLHILPGAIDVHVHFRDPGYPQKEDFASGTAAAAFGGVTTVFDMPNTLPTVADAASLAEKHVIAAAKAHVDYGLYAVLGEDSLPHVAALVEGGVIGFKLYMGNTFGRIPSPDTGAMLEAFEIVAPTGKRIALHAETNSVMERRESRLRAAAGSTPWRIWTPARRWSRSRRSPAPRCWPNGRGRVSTSCISRQRRNCGRCGTRRRAGWRSPARPARNIYSCPKADYATFGGIVRVNPPVREAVNQAPLWQALQDGTIDIIATDHAPHSREEKTRADIWTVDCGFPGVETQMPMMLTEVERGRMSLSGLRAVEFAEPGENLGALPAERRPAGRLGCRYRDRRPDRSLDGRRRTASDPREGDAVAWPPGDRAADSHAGARTFRHERAGPAGGCAGLGPVGPSDPEDAGTDRSQCGGHHGCHYHQDRWVNLRYSTARGSRCGRDARPAAPPAARRRVSRAPR